MQPVGPFLWSMGQTASGDASAVRNGQTYLARSCSMMAGVESGVEGAPARAEAGPLLCQGHQGEKVTSPQSKGRVHSAMTDSPQAGMATTTPLP